MPTGVRVCCLPATWSGFFPSRRADRTRRRVSTTRPCVTLSNVHSLWKTLLISRLFTPLPNAGRRCARATVPGSTAYRLDSPGAVQAREQQEQLRALENDRPPPIASDPASQIRSWLAEAEAGRWQAWWQLTYYLMLTPESRAFGDELDYFVTAMPGWGEADESASAPYRCRLPNDTWPKPKPALMHGWAMCRCPFFRNAIAGLRAFILLKQVSPEGYARIADETWRKWAPVIVGLPRRTRDRQFSRNRREF